ncbi:MAG: hypothetical protein LBP89_10130 [Helicobacteraceae bacterium]|jgi:hypothetical protein|nr:hypothetical protein [Helicobacteraceae bacterium]
MSEIISVVVMGAIALFGFILVVGKYQYERDEKSEIKPKDSVSTPTAA